jgi:integrase/DNA-directed RNA polymerase subunit RPC12/RpoP
MGNKLRLKGWRVALSTELLKCPDCGSNKIFRNGFAQSNFDVKIQRYLCSNCGRRFSDPDDLKKARQVANSYLPCDTNTLKSNNNDCPAIQLCVIEGTKKLVAETFGTQLPSVSLGKNEAPSNISLIVKDFQWQLKKEGKADVTIRNYGYSLLRLVKLGVDLFNPETFLEVMALQQEMAPIRKHGLTKAYRCFLTHNNIKAELPKVKFKRKIPYIPPKEHQNQLFSHCSPQMASFCFTLQATAARPIEALRLEWNDIDKAHKRIAINHPAKGGNSRSIQVNEELIDMLLSLPHLNGKLVFTYGTTDNAGTIFRRMRKRAIKKFNNPELKKISFYSCRYWRATKERHAKGNPDAVQYLLGHSSLAYVQIYAQLAAQCFGDQEYDVIEVRDPQTLREVIRKGYEKVTEMDGAQYFRKPKTE